MEVGPRDYLMEMLRLLSTVLGGSSRFLPMLASKADQCLQVGPRKLDSLSATPKVVELDGIAGEEGPYDIESVSTEAYDPGSDWTPAGVIYDFGALSEASSAWLGSLEGEYLDMPPFDVESLYQN
jgi:hypothetical protein